MAGCCLKNVNTKSILSSEESTSEEMSAYENVCSMMARLLLVYFIKCCKVSEHFNTFNTASKNECV